MSNIHNRTINKFLVSLSIKIHGPPSTHRTNRVAKGTTTAVKTQSQQIHRMPRIWTQTAMDAGCSPTQVNILVTQHADAEPPVSTHCEEYKYRQLIEALCSSVPSLFHSNLSQSSYQPIQQNFQYLIPPSYLNYPVNYPTHYEEQSFEYAILDQNSYFSSPPTLHPVI
jgi:hypothetical protein